MPELLPEPQTTRWQPLRLGLVDLFYYDDEQFWFHDGRLLLRGNNGTGKSKVLALTLPFLLDGSIAARRVRSEEHTSELQSRGHLVCRLLLEKKKTNPQKHTHPTH